ncbi:Fmu (Sun) domain protein [Pyrolobus fumarii 1A]|uniref:tRNA (cytosine(72)-C(5))-methyltransferase n=1 Tax=Pyrolobus fumarii (strain DSM 11204 / 1A) TaxID=694429 RepID=G0EF11_PYRF1|nr:RsmB/NOP family class I SAM-dependent RNA methyltransferase [Pyrolobus fumarii]AEM38908.1 Fmu (Sun) domain protein [Pyrolobus fumarii 1A]
MSAPCIEYDAGVIRELKRVARNDKALELLLSSLCEPPRRLYVRVNTMRADPGEVLDELREQGLRAYRDEHLEEAIWFPVEGPFRVPRVDKRVVVDKRTAESVLLGAHVYAPGVIDMEGVSKGDEVNIVAENGVVVAYGVAEMSWDEVREKRRGLAVRVVVSRFRAPSTRELSVWKRGLIYEQSLPAMWASRLLEPQPGEIVVDMCAAPGGKTGHLVELTRGKARIVAIDHSRSKIRRMVEELGRLGHLDLVHIEQADSRYLDLDYPMLRADRVLLDPPCTALGVIPKVYDRKTWRDVRNAAEYQWQFVKVAAKILKPGGRLVYSTCTLTVEENEAIVRRMEKLGLRLVELRAPRSSMGVDGLPVSRFLPSVQKMPGYFIAVLEKRG